MTRKYRQRGYQDEERGPDRGRRSGGERPEGPRGRGLGAPQISVSRCSRCGHELQATHAIAFDSRCEGCSSDLHSCVNCRYFDTSAVNECLQPIARRVARKSERNECDHFEVKTVVEFGKGEDEVGDARSAFDALFDL